MKIRKLRKKIKKCYLYSLQNGKEWKEKRGNERNEVITFFFALPKE